MIWVYNVEFCGGSGATVQNNDLLTNGDTT